MISIIIPTLNEENVLNTTLSSLRKGLRETPHEIIVTDGGSSDKTVAIAKRHGAKVVTDPQPGRQTIARGRNIGAAAATKEFIVFLDADVVIPDPDAFFREALRHFASRPDLVGLTAKLRVHRESETVADRLGYGYINMLNVVLNNILRRGGAAGEFQMIRISAFRQIGGYREHLVASEDYEFFGRLARVGRTHTHRRLTVFHSGRRPHKIGWPRLLKSWFLNAVWVSLFKRSFDREWTEIRSER